MCAFTARFDLLMEFQLMQLSSISAYIVKATIALTISLCAIRTDNFTVRFRFIVGIFTKRHQALRACWFLNIRTSRHCSIFSVHYFISLDNSLHSCDWYECHWKCWEKQHLWFCVLTRSSEPRSQCQHLSHLRMSEHSRLIKCDAWHWKPVKANLFLHTRL